MRQRTKWLLSDSTALLIVCGLWDIEHAPPKLRFSTNRPSRFSSAYHSTSCGPLSMTVRRLELFPSAIPQEAADLLTGSLLLHADLAPSPGCVAQVSKKCRTQSGTPFSCPPCANTRIWKAIWRHSEQYVPRRFGSVRLAGSVLISIVPNFLSVRQTLVHENDFRM